jgi:DNA-binding response OmpR family regulator
MRIWMLVPDDRLAGMMANALDEAGHDVARVASLAELRRIVPAATDLVVVDLSSAPDDADATFATLHRLRPRPRVLALGDRFLLHDRIMAAERAMEAYLPKPFSVRELLGMVSLCAAAGPRRR